MAIDSNLGAFVGAEEGAIESIPGIEGRTAQAWVNVRGGLREDFKHEGDRRFRIKATQSGHFCSRKSRGEAGTERAKNAEGVIAI